MSNFDYLDVDDYIRELCLNEYSMTECIRAVKGTYFLSNSEAEDIVCNHPLWSDTDNTISTEISDSSNNDFELEDMTESFDRLKESLNEGQIADLQVVLDDSNTELKDSFFDWLLDQ